MLLLQERRSSETDEHGVGHHRLHELLKLAALRAVTLVYEHEYLTDRWAGLVLQVLDESLEVVNVLVAEFVHQRTQ